MKTLNYFGLLTLLLCLVACSKSNESEEPTPTPTPPPTAPTITIDNSIITNGLSFTDGANDKSITFTTDADWTLSIAETRAADWCTPSATSGVKGTATVKFSVTENTGYDNRKAAVTIKAGSTSKTFTISQKQKDALLITTDKYEVEQAGGEIEVEVKANIDYQIEIAESAKSWINENTTRALTAKKHAFTIAASEEYDKREGEIYVKSGDKQETIKVYQAGGAVLLLSQNEYVVSDAGETITIDIKSNFEYGIQLPEVDWISEITDTRAASTHTLKYDIAPNKTYDSRSAALIFYDKNSDLKEIVKIEQVQKDALILSKSEYNVSSKGEIIEVALNSNVDFIAEILDADWIKTMNTRGLVESKHSFVILENTTDEKRIGKIVFKGVDSMLSDTVFVTQSGINTYYGDIIISTKEELEVFAAARYKYIEGDLIIKSIDGVQGFYALDNCLKEISGELYIYGDNITSFWGFYELEKVGSLTINRFIGNNFYGFDSLKRIEGSFRLVNECRPMRSFEGLNSLEYIGGTFSLEGDMYDFAEINSFNGLQTLKYIGGDLELSAEFHHLPTFEGFNSLEEIGGSLILRCSSQRTNWWSFDNIKNFKGFDSLKRIRGNFLLNASFDNLENFEGLDNLEYIGGLLTCESRSGIDYSAFNSLKSFEGLTSLKHLGGIELWRFEDSRSIAFSLLKDFSGLETISYLGEIYLNYVDGIESFKGLENIQNTKMKRICIYYGENSNLWTFDFFKRINEVESLHINVQVKNIEGFCNITKAKNLSIYNCSRLDNLSAFEKLIECEEIDISSNPELHDITALKNLSYCKRIYITSNPKLYDFTSLYNLFHNMDNKNEYMYYSISNNGYNPTKEQILNGEGKP